MYSIIRGRDAETILPPPDHLCLGVLIVERTWQCDLLSRYSTREGLSHNTHDIVPLAATMGRRTCFIFEADPLAMNRTLARTRS